MCGLVCEQFRFEVQAKFGRWVLWSCWQWTRWDFRRFQIIQWFKRMLKKWSINAYFKIEINDFKILILFFNSSIHFFKVLLRIPFYKLVNGTIAKIELEYGDTTKNITFHIGNSPTNDLNGLNECFFLLPDIIYSTNSIQ